MMIVGAIPVERKEVYLVGSQTDLGHFLSRMDSDFRDLFKRKSNVRDGEKIWTKYDLVEGGNISIEYDPRKVRAEISVSPNVPEDITNYLQWMEYKTKARINADYERRVYS